MTFLTLLCFKNSVTQTRTSLTSELDSLKQQFRLSEEHFAAAEKKIESLTKHIEEKENQITSEKCQNDQNRQEIQNLVEVKTRLEQEVRIFAVEFVDKFDICKEIDVILQPKLVVIYDIQICKHSS